jgi:hypothetical protein
VTEDDLKWLSSRWFTPKELAQLSVEVDRVLTF